MKDIIIPVVDRNKDTIVPDKPSTLVKEPLGLIVNAIETIKGHDINRLVEEFTSEMTLVAEGLSGDQERIEQSINALSAQQTIFEEYENKRADDFLQKIDHIEEIIGRIETRVAVIEKTGNSKEPQTKRASGSAPKQATWLAAIIAVAWIVTTILKILGG